MKLRHRLLISVGIAIVVLVVSFYWTATGSLNRGFSALEVQDSLEEVARARNAVNQLIDELHTRSADWSNWDDCYRFMADHNEAFVRSNLVDQSLSAAKLDLLLFVSNDGRLVRSARVPRQPNTPPPAEQEVMKALRLTTADGRLQLRADEFSGIVRTRVAPLIVSVRPILTSAAKGPRHGWLVFGRYFDRSEIEQLAERTRLQVRAIPPDYVKRVAESATTVVTTSGGAPAWLRPASDQRLAAYTIVTDIDRQPQFALEIELPRNIHLQGLSAVGVLTRLCLVLAVLIGVATVAIVERSCLSRIARLTRQVVDVGETRDAVDVSGRDEIATLADRINGMVSAVRTAEEQLREYSAGLEVAVGERTRELAQKNAVLENAVDGIARLDAAGCYVSANRAYAEMLGCEPDQLIGRHWAENTETTCMDEIRRLTAACRDGRQTATDTCMVSDDGARIYVDLVLIPEVAADGEFTGHHRFAKDVSLRRRLESQITHQTYHDGLTGLPNRMLLLERLTKTVMGRRADPHPFAVVSVDLDRFKSINDSFGHDAGDMLLMEVADRLRKCVRPSDTVSRMSGDQFVIILETTDTEEDACHIADTAAAVLRRVIQLPQREVFITCSVGVRYCSGGETDVQALIRDADTAMHHAKESGRTGAVLFVPAMQTQALERIEIEMNLPEAVQRNQIKVHYQPLVDLATGKYCGLEALARWQSDGGMVLPSKFIPAAEESGHIVAIGYCVLEQACRQLREWQESFPDAAPVSVNVNLSGKQLQEDDVVQRVEEILYKTGLQASALKLEITESTMLANLENVGDKLSRLRRLGVKLAIDDFGTGYSSLSTLNSLPVNTVKIDRAFVSRLGDDPEAAAIIAAIVMVAKTLEMDVTGEGIETPAQVMQLQGLGCDLGQGYYFGKPMPPTAVTKLLEDGAVAPIPERSDTDREQIESLLRGLSLGSGPLAA